MSPAQSMAEDGKKRMDRRIAVKLPVKIRGIDPEGVRFEEATRTENLCRGGMAITIRHSVAPGAILEISLPVPSRGSHPASDFDTRGRVVHVKLVQEQKENIVGIALTGPRFNRVFIPETA